MPSLHVLLALLMLPGCSTLLGQTPALAKEREVRIDAPLEEGGQVRLEGVAGAFTIHPWDKPAVKVRGRITEGVKEVRHQANPKRFTLEVEHEDSWFSSDNGEAHLEIWLPQRLFLEVKVVSARVELEGRHQRCVLETVSGDLSMKGEVGEAELETVSGDLSLDAATQRLTVESVSGDITSTQAHGEVDARSVSGRLSFAPGPFTRLRLKAVSGSIELRGALEGGSYQAQTQSGDIRLWIPKAQQAQLKLHSFSGKIRQEIASGEAGPRVNLQSFSGDVTVSPL